MEKQLAFETIEIVLPSWGGFVVYTVSQAVQGSYYVLVRKMLKAGTAFPKRLHLLKKTVNNSKNIRAKWILA